MQEAIVDIDEAREDRMHLAPQSVVPQRADAFWRGMRPVRSIDDRFTQQIPGLDAGAGSL